jgi:acetoacetyl-CoA reductase
MTTAQAAPFTTGGRALQGRVALVTGGTRGIGAAISRSLGSAGATVAAGYTRDDDAAQRFIKDFCAHEDHHGSVHRGNVGNTDDCERVVQEVIDQHGRLDILVNNAGITSDKSVLKMSYEDWDKVIRVNLSGAFYMAKPALTHMVERGTGRIVNISSVIGQQGNIGQANYASSKAGLFGFSKSLAKEVARKGVTVNCVAPGYIETEMVAAIPDEVREKLLKGVPMGRLGQCREIARAVQFLVDDDAGYITGSVIDVNGGLEM